MAAETPALPGGNGATTSEFWLKIAVYVLTFVTTILSMWQGNAWVQLAMTGISAVVAFLNSHTYSANRTALKTAAVNANALRATVPGLPPSG